MADDFITVPDMATVTDTENTDLMYLIRGIGLDRDKQITVGDLTKVMRIDTITEQTTNNGISIEGVLLKDNEVSVDVINEKTSTVGVTIDSVLLKDNAVTANSMITTTLNANEISDRSGGVIKFNDIIEVDFISATHPSNTVTFANPIALKSIVSSDSTTLNIADITFEDNTILNSGGSVIIEGTTFSSGSVSGTTLTATGSVVSNIINESTGGSGVTIDSVLLKDNSIVTTGIYGVSDLAISSGSTDFDKVTILGAPTGGTVEIESTILRDNQIIMNGEGLGVSGITGKGILYLYKSGSNFELRVRFPTNEYVIQAGT